MVSWAGRCVSGRNWELLLTPAMCTNQWHYKMQRMALLDQRLWIGHVAIPPWLSHSTFLFALCNSLCAMVGRFAVNRCHRRLHWSKWSILQSVQVAAEVSTSLWALLHKGSLPKGFLLSRWTLKFSLPWQFLWTCLLASKGCFLFIPNSVFVL